MLTLVADAVASTATGGGHHAHAHAHGLPHEHESGADLGGHCCGGGHIGGGAGGWWRQWRGRGGSASAPSMLPELLTSSCRGQLGAQGSSWARQQAPAAVGWAFWPTLCTACPPQDWPRRGAGRWRWAPAIASGCTRIPARRSSGCCPMVGVRSGRRGTPARGRRVEWLCMGLAPLHGDGAIAGSLHLACWRSAM